MSSIARQLVQAIRPVCPVYVDEAETNRAPYAVYTLDEEAVLDMDGICGWDATVSIAVCATTFDGADTLADAVIAAVEGLRSTLGVKLDSRQPYETSEAKLYVVILSYTIKEAL